jgi:hypothetical protein
MQTQAFGGGVVTEPCHDCDGVGYPECKDCFTDAMWKAPECWGKNRNQTECSCTCHEGKKPSYPKCETCNGTGKADTI